MWLNKSYLLTCEEEKAVTFIFLTHVNLDDGADRRLKVVSLWFRSIENLHRVRPSGDSQQRTVVEVNLELAGI